MRGVQAGDSHPSTDTLVALVEGRLSEQELHRLRDHLGTCAECPSLVAELKDSRADALDAPRPAPPMDPVKLHQDTAPRDAPRPLESLAPGSVVAGRFRLQEMLGSGGMGVVWAAVNVNTLAPWALKFLRPHLARDDEWRGRFRREAKAPKLIQHPSVVEIHDLIELEDGTPVLVMDLLQGESLGKRLARQGRIPLPELARILLPVVSAVAAAHRAGVVHRDLKPDNIFLERLADGTEVSRVLDFGMAKLVATEGDAAASMALTHAGQQMGTCYYMSPEQAAGETVDERCDVWALGVVLRECLTGARPFIGANVNQVMRKVLFEPVTPLQKVMPDAPLELCRIANRLLARDLAKRPTDLSELMIVLTRLSELPQSSSRPAPVGIRASWRWVFGSAAAMFVLGAAAIVWTQAPRPAPAETARATPMSLEPTPTASTVPTNSEASRPPPRAIPQEAAPLAAAVVGAPMEQPSSASSRPRGKHTRRAHPARLASDVPASPAPARPAEPLPILDQPPP